MEEGTCTQKKENEFRESIYRAQEQSNISGKKMVGFFRRLRFPIRGNAKDPPKS